MPNSRHSSAIFSPSSSRAMNLSRSSIGLHSFQGIFALPQKALLCNPCLRNELSPFSQEGHQMRGRLMPPSFVPKPPKGSGQQLQELVVIHRSRKHAEIVRQSHVLFFLAQRGRTVFQGDYVKPAFVGTAHGRFHATVGEKTAQNDGLNPLAAQNEIEV